MNPIAQALYLYDRHLDRGGEPVTLDKHGPDRGTECLHPSSLLLCARKAAYDFWADGGKLKEDLPHPKELLLDFRVGYLFEWFVAEALHFANALIDYQPSLKVGDWCGSPDLIVDANVLTDQKDSPWLVDVKTVRSADSSFLATRSKFPKDHNCAQVEKYARMWEELYGTRPRPVLFYVLRGTMASELFTWDMHPEGDLLPMAWVENEWWSGWDSFSVGKDRWNEGFDQRMLEYEGQLEKFKRSQILPRRPWPTPDTHNFLCVSVNKDRKRKMATPRCQYFAQCWGVDSCEPFQSGTWGKGWWE